MVNSLKNKKQEVSLEIAQLLDVKTMALTRLFISLLVSITLFIIPYFVADSASEFVIHTIVGICGLIILFLFLSIYSILYGIRSRIIDLIQLFYRLKSETLNDLSNINANKAQIAKEIANEYFIPSITATISSQIPLIGSWLAKKIVSLFEKSTSTKASTNEGENNNVPSKIELSESNLKFVQYFDKAISPIKWGLILAICLWLIEIWVY